MIERAKGVVMHRLGVAEEEAFRCLQRLASDGNRRLVEVAQETLAAEEVFAVLEQIAALPPGRPALRDGREELPPRSQHS